MFGTKVVSFVAGAGSLLRSLTLSLPARPVRDGRFRRRARWPPIIRAERAARTHSKLWAKYCFFLELLWTEAKILGTDRVEWAAELVHRQEATA